jgi:hypothetical protein
MGRHVARMGNMKNVYKILVAKPNRKKPFRRFGRGWEDNIRTDVTEIRWNVLDWIHLVRDVDQWRALVNTVMNLRVP